MPVFQRIRLQRHWTKLWTDPVIPLQLIAVAPGGAVMGGAIGNTVTPTREHLISPLP